MKPLIPSVAESHRLYLQDLVRQELSKDYTCRDYLSANWQKNLQQKKQQQQQQRWRNCNSNEDDDDEKEEGIIIIDENVSKEEMHVPSSSSSMEEGIHPPASNDETVTAIGKNNIFGDKKTNDNQQQKRESPTSTVTQSTFETSSSNVTSTLECCIHWRTKIIEWKYQIVDTFHLPRELVSISTYYLDQYLSNYYILDTVSLPFLFQVVATTSLYLAIKIHSPKKKVHITAICRSSNGRITKTNIEEMEISILSSLRWCLSPPTPVSFLDNIFPLIMHVDMEYNGYSDNNNERGDNNDNNSLSQQQMLLVLLDPRIAMQLLEFATFLIELSICAYPLVPLRSSSIAIAAIMYSIEVHCCQTDVNTAEEGYDWNVLSEALHTLLHDTTLNLVVAEDASEIRMAGKLLREVYLLSIPANNTPPLSR
jgi:hypothetical protein